MTLEKLREEVKKKAFWRFQEGSQYHVQTSESGLHSNQYLNTDIIISEPPLVERIVKEYFCEELRKRNIETDWVVSYPPFGISLGHELARQLGAKFAYIDTKQKTCDFPLEKEERVLVLGDDIYSGTALEKTIQVLREKEVEVQKILLSIGNFSGRENILGVEVLSLLTEKGNLYKQEDCEMCQAGSQALLPRSHWNLLRNRP